MGSQFVASIDQSARARVAISESCAVRVWGASRAGVCTASTHRRIRCQEKRDALHAAEESLKKEADTAANCAVLQNSNSVMGPRQLGCVGHAAEV